jgi:hypothetical protein
VALGGESGKRKAGAGRGTAKKQGREARERARLYHARQEFQEGRKRRRTRDNLLAGLGGGVLILAIIGGQVAYFTVGPGQPVPTPTPTPTVSTTPAPTPEPTGTPTPTSESTEGATPTPSPTP